MSTQSLTYKEMYQGLYNKYNSIPYPTLRTMAREAGFVQRYGEGRDKFTLCTFLVDRDAERIEALGTHEMNFDDWRPMWEGNSWNTYPFMELFGGDKGRCGDGTAIANAFKQRNSWAPEHVVQHVCDIFLYLRWATCQSVEYLTDGEDEDEPEPPPKGPTDPGNRIAVTYEISPARASEDGTLHQPSGEFTKAGWPITSFNGSLYKSSWTFDGEVFHEDSRVVNTSGDHVFRSPWKRVE